MEIDYLNANIMEGSIWKRLSSHCGQVSLLLQTLEINQSLGFYLFTARGNDCRLIKSLVLSDRNSKTKLIFVSGFWVRHPVDVGRDTFAPYTGDLGNLRPEGMPLPFSFIFIFILFYFYYIDY